MMADYLDQRIDHDSHIPLYVQLKEILGAQLQREGGQPGDQLPGELELCSAYGVRCSARD
jgi:DNA-binding GntR family transcriptional regulator